MIDLRSDSHTAAEFALGRLARGIVHEAVNPLNSILMNAELARACMDDQKMLKQCLDSIAETARSSGQRLQQLSELATTDNFQPAGKENFDVMLRDARALLGSRAMREGCTVEFSNSAGVSAILNRTACAAAVALVVDALIETGAKQIYVEPGIDPVLNVSIECDCEWDPSEPYAEVAGRFAQRVCADHGADYFTDRNQIVLRLAPAAG